MQNYKALVLINPGILKPNFKNLADLSSIQSRTIPIYPVI